MLVSQFASICQYLFLSYITWVLYRSWGGTFFFPLRFSSWAQCSTPLTRWLILEIHSFHAMRPVRFLFKLHLLVVKMIILLVKIVNPCDDHKMMCLSFLSFFFFLPSVCCISYWDLGASSCSPCWRFHSTFQLRTLCRSVISMNLSSPSSLT